MVILKNDERKCLTEARRNMWVRSQSSHRLVSRWLRLELLATTKKRNTG